MAIEFDDTTLRAWTKSVGLPTLYFRHLVADQLDLSSGKMRAPRQSSFEGFGRNLSASDPNDNV
jgi:hypothetical protein